MRIISPYKDYYDNIGYYSDYPIWVRKTREYCFDISIPLLDYKQLNFLKDLCYSVKDYHKRNLPATITTQTYVVSVCGKLYFIYTHSKYNGVKLITKAFTDLHKFITEITNNNKRLSKNIFDRYIWVTPNTYDAFDKNSVEQYIDRFSVKNTLDSIHVSLDTPIFCVPIDRYSYFNSSGGRIIINPNMKDIGFHHVIDVYTMHQNIDMYLGNTLVKEKSIPEFNDILKRDAHGMDEWSFKKKGKKK